MKDQVQELTDTTRRSIPGTLRDTVFGYPNLTMFAVLAVLLLVLPALVTNNYHLSILVFIGLNTMLTIGLSLLMGYTGQISLGHAVFYGSGAYLTTILMMRYGWAPLPAIGAAALVTAVLAYLIGIPIFRLRGHYLALATVALNIIFEIFLVTETRLTGGPNGLFGIPRLGIGDWIITTDRGYYYVVWAVTLVVLAASLNIVNSRVGRALRAVHGGEVAAATMGVDVNKFKLKVLTLSAVYASVAGSLFAFFMQIVTPSSFSFLFSVQLVVMVAIGGLASVWGGIFGAAVVTLLGEVLRNVMPQFAGGVSAEFEILAFGIILILIMIFMPQGLTVGLAKRLRS